MRSIQFQLTLGLTIAMIIISLLGGGVLITWLRRATQNEFDQSLIANANALRTLISQKADGSVDVDVNMGSVTGFTGLAAEYFAFFNANGQQLAASGPVLLGEPPTSNTFLWDARMPNGAPARAVQILFQPAREEDDDAEAAAHSALIEATSVRLVVARDRTPLDLMLVRTTVLVAAETLAVSVVAAVSSVFVIRRGLASLNRLSTEVASIDVTQSRSILDAANRPRELGPIVHRLNELLERMAIALRRERQFSAAVSHEFRTPIAELRAVAEVALKHPDDTDFARRVATQGREIAIQMQTLVTTLLEIVSIERSAETTALTDVVLKPVLRRCIEQQRTEHLSRGVQLQIHVATHLSVLGDSALVAGIVSNLLGNAFQYANANSMVCVTADIEGSAVRLTVENEQDALTAEDVARVFEPFWRGDRARSDGQHVGLGLALVQRYCAVIGASVEARLTDKKRYSVSVLFQASHQESTDDCSATLSHAASRVA